jgi:hypothetical protein
MLCDVQGGGIHDHLALDHKQERNGDLIAMCAQRVCERYVLGMIEYEVINQSVRGPLQLQPGCDACP